MCSDRSPHNRRHINTHPTVSFWMVLAACLLLLTVSNPTLAVSGSTRLTIHLDQSAVDAIARWKGEEVIAEWLMPRLLPAARAGLSEALHPQSAERILQRLRSDTLLFSHGRAEHIGSAGGCCVSGLSAGGRLIHHSI